MRTPRLLGLFLVGCLAAPVAGRAHERVGPLVVGGLVEVSVEVGGRGVPLYPAPDGSRRHYLEAREGAAYAVSLRNRTGERVGVVLAVDGLNAISGTRDEGRGRMYVLAPWGQATVRGWRTSLKEVRRFTFVDERRSYAARTDQTNARMGWIEAAVYREQPRAVRAPRWREESRKNDAPAAPEAADAERSSTGRDEASRPAASEGEAKAARQGASYPGTGWGRRTHDPVVLVSFAPEPAPAECVTLRYEYRPALVALGVLPQPLSPRNRLWERDRGEGGFARPPSW